MLNQSEESASMKKLPNSKMSAAAEGKSQLSGGQTSNDILFLKRLLFLKASLDNEGSLSNFPVPFNEEKAFKHDSGLSDVNMMNFDINSDKNETQLMLQNGEEGQPLLQLMPPTGYERYGAIRQAQTAGTKLRSNRGGTERAKNTKYNSLNLTGTTNLTNRNDQLGPILLGKIEQHKFTTTYDIKVEQEKEDALKRKAQIDRLYMPILD